MLVILLLIILLFINSNKYFIISYTISLNSLDFQILWEAWDSIPLVCIIIRLVFNKVFCYYIISFIIFWVAEWSSWPTHSIALANLVVILKIFCQLIVLLLSRLILYFWIIFHLQTYSKSFRNQVYFIKLSSWSCKVRFVIIVLK